MKIVSFLAQSFYCAGVMMAFTLAALMTSIRYYKRHGNLRIFTYYIVFSLLSDLTSFFAYPYIPVWNLHMIVAMVTQVAFVLFDFIVCNLFILRYIGSPIRRRIIRINGLLFFGLLIFLYFGISLNAFGETYLMLDSVFLVLPCLFYFYELFLTMNLLPLKNQPAFWVITGIFFLHTGDTLLLFAAPFLGSYAQAAYSLNFILFSLFFTLLIRAYLCPPEKNSKMENAPDTRSSGPHPESVYPKLHP